MSGLLVGWIVGGRFRRYECADPACTRALKHHDATCAGCGGSVVGTIASERDRLGAEEDLADGTFRSLD